MPPRKATAPKQVKSTTHSDKRTNIPTEELRDFVADDERNPIPVVYARPLLYPRDPDADPQLVWRGKDEQDSGPLTVPAVPLYIQEKIDPRALVEDLRRAGPTGKPKEQLLLFEDFDGLEGYEQVEFYEHAANWSNRMVLGDALLVMNSMAEKEKLRGQVQMVYVDPPYGIKFGSNWQVSTRKRDVKDGSDASRQPEQVKAFRDTWQDGINSYLTYLRDRLIVARDLLTDSGSIFIQMGDENVHLVRCLLDEVFGPENFVSLISFVTTSGGYEKTNRDGSTTIVPGALGLFSNEHAGGWAHRPVTILVDSEQLDRGDALSQDFKRAASAEIEQFKREYRERFPGADVETLTDEDVLREVMNTVGKPGRLGSNVRCVVSVSMLTEGWDATTVTHILGVRAFGTQLLCEQVVGRGLRRRSFALDADGRFSPEYAEVYGVPFSFIPASGATKEPPPRQPITHVRSLPERAAARITFPRLDGYRWEVPDENLHADWTDESKMLLAAHHVPTTTEVAGIVGEVEVHTLDDLKAQRPKTVAFELAKLVLDRYFQYPDAADVDDMAKGPRPWLFPRLVEISRSWMAECVTCQDHAFPQFTDARELPRAGDYLLWYAKSKPNVKARKLWDKSDDRPGYRWIALPDGTKRGMTAAEQRGDVPLPNGARIYKPGDIQSQGASSSPQPFAYQGKTYNPGTSSHWKANYPDGMERLALAGRIHVAKNSIQYVRFADDFGYQVRTNLWTDTGTGNFTDDKVYVVQTNTKVVERCILLTTDPGDLILDPTCGSGTTAFAAEQWGRRWITIDTSRVALALAKTRLMSARYPFYLLADSVEGAAKERELTGHQVPAVQHNCDIRHGFVYERVPHVMLGDIARNEKIVPGLSQEEINRLISLDAEQELLVDRPYEDASKVRVSGRFTVESLSPHRTLDQVGGSGHGDAESFVSTIVENLRVSGVQNTFRGERLAFDVLESYAGDGILHAHGTITDADGEVRTVAVMIGPEHGTVSPDMVKDAAREALKGAGFDILVVCGFAFEAYASETAKEFAPSGDGFVAAEDERKMGRLRVLLTHMNPDLAMSNELLKKTGTGNLFTVFGEPDITITRPGKEIVIEVHGVDVYDPTTGVVRPSSTDDIACWFVDTDYDGEQFFVRHAYFTGADKPYEKLQRSLLADIDEAAWASLYSTKSRPFPPPTTGRIAVKVINHYGDEVLQVYEVAQ